MNRRRIYTETELEIMKADYQIMKQNRFCEVYRISTTSAIQMFGKKTGGEVTLDWNKRVHKEREERLKTNSERRFEEVMQKTGLSEGFMMKYLTNYTLSEIESGEMVNGKFRPKEIVKIYK